MACFSTLERKEERGIKKIGASEGRENSCPQIDIRLQTEAHRQRLQQRRQENT